MSPDAGTRRLKLFEKARSFRFGAGCCVELFEKWPDLYFSSLDGHFLKLRHMKKSSAAGQAQKAAKRPDLYILSLAFHFYIAPYEQFISG